MSAPCKHCKKHDTLIDDDYAGDCVCTSCGMVQYSGLVDYTAPNTYSDRDTGVTKTTSQWEVYGNPYFLDKNGSHMRLHADAMRKMRDALCNILRGDTPAIVLWRARELFEEKYAEQLSEMRRPARIAELETEASAMKTALVSNPHHPYFLQKLEAAEQKLAAEKLLPTRKNFSKQKQHMALSLFIALQEQRMISENMTAEMICASIKGGGEYSSKALASSSEFYLKQADSTCVIPRLVKDSLKSHTRRRPSSFRSKYIAIGSDIARRPRRTPVKHPKH